MPSSGGSGKYVAVAAVLLLGIGALLVWRFALNKPEPVAVIPTASPVTSGSGTAAPVDPRIDDIPPPPPIVDSGPETGPAHTGKAGQIVVVQGGGCEGKCVVTSSPEVEAVLRQRAAAARSCYEGALKSDPQLRGRVVVAIRIAPNGAVCSAAAVQNELGAGVGGCVASMFRGVTYPAPRGGCIDANVPISFVPQGR